MFKDLAPVRYFLDRSFERKLRNQLDSSTASAKKDIYVRDVAILFDCTEKTHRSAVFAFGKHLKKKRIKPHYLGYIAKNDHADLLKIPIYTDEDVKMNGSVDLEKIADFVQRPWDILFCVTDKAPKHMVYITALSKAHLKLGYPAGPQKYLDIMIDVENPQDLSEFFNKAETVINSICPSID